MDFSLRPRGVKVFAAVFCRAALPVYLRLPTPSKQRLTVNGVTFAFSRFFVRVFISTPSGVTSPITLARFTSRWATRPCASSEISETCAAAEHGGVRYGNRQCIVEWRKCSRQFRSSASPTPMHNCVKASPCWRDIETGEREGELLLISASGHPLQNSLAALAGNHELPAMTTC